jgi:hypothetical protein
MVAGEYAVLHGAEAVVVCSIVVPPRLRSLCGGVFFPSVFEVLSRVGGGVEVEIDG